MIDLRIKGLPNTIMVDGKSFFIKTDFREWLKIGELLKDKETKITDIAYVVEDISLLDLIKNQEAFKNAIIDFYLNENATPHSISESSTPILDYIQDGEYIVGSFMQAYGIDLTSCDMHWHRFKALCFSLPEETKIQKIMSIRGYRKTSKSYESQCEELKRSWSLDVDHTHDEELMSEINDEFYNA